MTAAKKVNKKEAAKIEESQEAAVKTLMKEIIGDNPKISDKEIEKAAKNVVALDKGEFVPVFGIDNAPPVIGTVTIDGKLIEPSAKDVVVTDFRLEAAGTSFFLPLAFMSKEEAEGRKFSLYKLDLKYAQCDIWMDDKSAAQFSSNSFHQCPAPSQFVNNMYTNTIMLINSSIKNCQVYGNSILKDVDLSRCFLYQSRIIKEDKARNKTYPNVPFFNENARNLYTGSSFTNSEIINSILENDGEYRDVFIENTSILKNSPTSLYMRQRIKRATLKNCVLDIKSLTMSGVYMEDVRVTGGGNVSIKNTRFYKQEFVDTDLYVVNKFCTMTIDLPGRELWMIRVSDKELELGMQWNIKRRIPIDTCYDTLIDIVEKMLEASRKSQFDYEPISYKHGKIEDSIMCYIVESISSRLKMITLLDSAARIHNQINNEMPNPFWDNEPF